ncbi:MAG TPA: cation transporter dimerization domain-containing protein, partial [Polyangia bacterium]
AVGTPPTGDQSETRVASVRVAHLEVDREMTVRQSHQLAHQVQLNILARLEWVADVLVHVEPAP